MTRPDKPLLLAPAGSKEALIAAVEGGADAVYIGGGSFSARAFAKNFSDEDIAWAVDYCHLRQALLYVAVNTLVTDRELGEVARFIAFLYQIGADALIIQDIGVALMAREIAPELSLHISTQATVTDAGGALFFKRLGFSCAIVSRELSKGQIADIVRAAGIPVEIFVHGAICVCYSGQCLMSSHIGGRSGNRGKCAQPCRLPYKIGDQEGFLLSPKDMNLIKRLDEIKEIGVSALKIEGRMKGAEYVAETVGIYRKYLDTPQAVTQEDAQRLERIFYRGGFTDAYFTGQKGADMLCRSKPDNPYQMQVGGASPYKSERKRRIAFRCIARLGKPLVITAIDNLGHTAQATGSVSCEKAVNTPLTCERLRQQLSKLGDTVFMLSEVQADIDAGISLPVSEINAVRRQAVMLLAMQITDSYKRRQANAFTLTKTVRPPSDALKFAVQITNEDQLGAFSDDDYDCLYLPLDIAVKQNTFTDKTVVVLPRVSPPSLEETLVGLGIRKALMTNIGQYLTLQKLGFEIYIDHSINVFNSLSAGHFTDAKLLTPSTELMLSQIRCIGGSVPIEVIAYGRLPLMLTENCLIKSSAGCKGGDALTDRTGARFPVLCREGCRNEIFNSKPLVMSDKLGDIKSSGISSVRLYFTVESPSECAEILRRYKNRQAIDTEFTRGKFYKGV